MTEDQIKHMVDRFLGWRCFHCGKVFVDREAAQEHFGASELCDPACQIDIAKFREMEALHDRHLNEDSDTDRRYYAQQAAHAVALREEEEKGYERGLRDAWHEAWNALARLELLLREAEG